MKASILYAITLSMIGTLIVKGETPINVSISNSNVAKSVAASIPSAEKEAIQLMRARFLSSVAGIGLKVQNPDYLAYDMRRLDTLVERLLVIQNTDQTSAKCGSFQLGQTFESDALQRHFFVTCDLAQAYACPSSRYHGNAMLLERLTLALNYAKTNIRPENFKGNWWTWDIGALRELTTTLLLVGDQLPKDLYAELVVKLDLLPPMIFRTARGKGITVGWKSYPDMYRGVNPLDVLLNHLFVGLVKQDPQYVADVVAQAHMPLSIDHERLPGGIQPDWTPYGTWGQLANDGYGSGLMETAARLVYLTDGTPWQLPSELRQNVYGLFDHFWRWNVFQGFENPSISGRGVTSPGNLQDVAIAGAALMLLQTPVDAEFRGKALDYLAEWAHGWRRDQPSLNKGGPASVCGDFAY